jgi:hypothetical protein
LCICLDANPNDRRQYGNPGDSEQADGSGKCGNQQSNAHQKHNQWQLPIADGKRNNHSANPGKNRYVNAIGHGNFSDGIRLTMQRATATGGRLTPAIWTFKFHNSIENWIVIGLYISTFHTVWRGVG